MKRLLYALLAAAIVYVGAGAVLLILAISIFANPFGAHGLLVALAAIVAGGYAYWRNFGAR